MEVKFKNLNELDPIVWKKNGKPKINCAVTDCLADCPDSHEAIQFEGGEIGGGLKRYASDYDEEAKEWSFVDGDGNPWCYTYRHAFSILANQKHYNEIKGFTGELDEALASKAATEKLIEANEKLNKIIKWLAFAAVVTWVATLAIII